MPKKNSTILVFSIILLLVSQPVWAQRQRVQVGPGGGGGGGRTQVTRQVSSPRVQSQPRSAPRVQVRDNTPRVRQAVNVSRPRNDSYRPSSNQRPVVNTQRYQRHQSDNNRSGRAVVTPQPGRSHVSNGRDRINNDGRGRDGRDRFNNNGRGQTIVNPGVQRNYRSGQEPGRYYNSGGSPRNISSSPNLNRQPDGRTRIVTGPGNSPNRTRVTTPSRYYPVATNQPTQVINNNYYYNNNRRYVPRYSSWNDPYFYSNHNFRRSHRFYQPCAIPFLSLGFFAARPYSYYDYSRMSYAQPFLYGDDSYYRSAPLIDNTSVASATPTAPVQSLEQDLLSELSHYVDSHSKNGQFQLTDPAFGNQVWNLDLTEAPAVYSIDSNHYTVVAGFEGSLGENSVPSAVGLEFFVARENGVWKVKEGWIVSANGIPRAKKFQSPSYPQVQTWQEGALCPFTGQRMVPVTESSPQQG